MSSNNEQKTNEKTQRQNKVRPTWTGSIKDLSGRTVFTVQLWANLPKPKKEQDENEQ